MDEAINFSDMLARVRMGDEAAAAELVRRYEPEIRRAIRVRLTDPNLRRVVDSADICQSVLGAFFVRVAAGQFDLAEPAQLVKLLARMARNKIFDHANKKANRASRSAESGLLEQAIGPDETPSRIIADAELLAKVRSRLSEEERDLIELRTVGRSWQEIGAAKKMTPDSVRKKLERALDRVCAEFQID